MSRKGNEITRELFKKVEKDGLPIDTTDWRKVRIQASIAAMQGITPEWGNNARQYAEWAVQVADALIEELKKGGEQ